MGIKNNSQLHAVLHWESAPPYWHSCAILVAQSFHLFGTNLPIGWHNFSVIHSNKYYPRSNEFMNKQFLLPVIIDTKAKQLFQLKITLVIFRFRSIIITDMNV